MAILDTNTLGKPLNLKQGFFLGHVSGTFWYLGNCYWIYPTMHLYGGIPEPAAIGILILFSLYVGLYLGMFGVCLALLNSYFPRSVTVLLIPCLWVAVELARARITGFPWDLLGYTQIDNSFLTRLAPWTGVFGLSLLVAIVNVLWMSRLRARWWRYAGVVAAAVLVVAFSLLGLRTRPELTSGAKSHAVLLQENLEVGAAATGNPVETRAQMLQSFSKLSVQAATVNPQVLIWPEAPADFFDADEEFRTGVGSLAAREHAPVIANSISIARHEQGSPLQLYNSASFFAVSGLHVSRYDKMHLVPFGEYTPYKQLFFFAGHLLDNVGPFVPGKTRQLFAAQGHSYGVFICYESIFGDEIREFAKTGADVLVNISDDGWYGDSSAPWEHLDMVRMRAIENDRWVLRATNTGVTASIDPLGRIVARMPRHTRGSIEVPFSYNTELTFYTMHGDWLAWICAAVSLLALGAAFIRRSAVNEQGAVN